MSAYSPKLPLHALLEETANTYPDKTALIYDDQELSYAKLDCVVNQFANALVGLGVAKGDRVALYLPNGVCFVAAFFGVLKAGGVVSAVSPLHREREVEAQLVDSGATVIVTLGNLKPVLANITEKTKLQQVIVTEPTDCTFSGLLTGASTDKPKVSVHTEDLAALQYTGGTTGTTKAAMLTHHNLACNATQFAIATKASADDVFLTALPLFHIYGLTTSLTTPISAGATIVLMQKFEPKTALETIQRYNVSVFCGVPTMYQLLLSQPDLANYDLSSLRVCISGASALPPSVQAQFIAASGGFLAEGYGLTEASPVTHCNPVDKVQLHVGSIGLPLPDTEARILDLETGTLPLAVGKVGELAVKGPQIMAGYWNRPAESAQVLHDGWLQTGDIARKDKDGFYYIVDRKKDLLKHKGYSVYPRELEDIFYEHPVVKLCAVVGKPTPDGDEVPVAFVVLKAGAVTSAEELKAFVNGKVAVYKAIREIRFVEDLPLSPAGKVLKRNLRA